MSAHDFIGVWALSGTIYVSGQLELDGNAIAPGVHDAWLRGTSHGDLTMLEPATGLTLSVHEDATFDEVGESTVTLFDPNGVEISGDVPYSGRLKTTSNGVSVFTDAATIPDVVTQVSDPSILRVSHDVDIAERLDLVDGRLIRTTNAVTDGIYTVRVVLAYDRTDRPADRPEPSNEPAAANTEDDPERLRLQEEIVAGVIDAATTTWERIIVKVEALFMGAHSKQQGYLTFCVHRGDDGVHRIEQFDVDAVDHLFIALRERIFEIEGKRWGTCVLRIDAPRQVDFQVSFEASPMSKGEYVRDDYYQRHLPFFLADRGLDR